MNRYKKRKKIFITVYMNKMILVTVSHATEQVLSLSELVLSNEINCSFNCKCNRGSSVTLIVKRKKKKKKKKYRSQADSLSLSLATNKREVGKFSFPSYLSYCFMNKWHLSCCQLAPWGEMEGCSLFRRTVEYICNELANTGRHTWGRQRRRRKRTETWQDENEVLYDELSDPTTAAAAGWVKLKSRWSVRWKNMGNERERKEN